MVDSEVMAMKADMEKDTVKFSTEFTRARKKFTQALLAGSYVFPSLT